jgi:RNA polymerase sigma-70 factor (ECF subfamily)
MTEEVTTRAVAAGGPAGAAAPMDRAEFAARFQQASRPLLCIAAAVLGRADQAEDVVQEAALIALTKLHDFDPRTNFTAWMGRIVRFTALNVSRGIRRASVRHIAQFDRWEIEDERPSLAPGAMITGRGQLHADQRSFDDHVMAALHELSETARACLLLRTLMDMPYREISRTLDIPEGTAMSLVHRARAAMRGSLSAAHAPAGGTR